MKRVANQLLLRRLSPFLSLTTTTNNNNGLINSSLRSASSTPGKVQVTFIEKDGKEIKCVAPVGESLMEVAKFYKVNMEAACAGTCCCSTCHVYLDPRSYELVPKPDCDEEDMLDLALAVREGSSRLACQIKITEKLDGLVAELPAETANQML